MIAALIRAINLPRLSNTPEYTAKRTKNCHLATDKSSSPAARGAPNNLTNAAAAAKFLLSQTSLRPKIGLVLGSGLGGFADELSDATRIPYSNIPFFPRSTALGHAGQMVVGNAAGVTVAAMQGRVHLYEGYSAREV